MRVLEGVRKKLLKQKASNERGSVTLFVLIAMLFFLTVGVIIFITNMNNSTTQHRDINKIKSEYNGVDVGTLDDLYREQERKQSGKLVVSVVDNLNNIYSASNGDDEIVWMNSQSNIDGKLPLKVDVSWPEGVSDDKKEVILEGNMQNGTNNYSRIVINADNIFKKEGQILQDLLKNITQDCDITVTAVVNRGTADEISAQIRIKVDITTPVVAIDDSGIVESTIWKLPDANAILSSTVNATDNLTNIRTISYILDHNEATPASNAEWKDYDNGISEEVQLGEGTYYIHVKATDSAGNEGYSTKGPYTVRKANYEATAGNSTIYTETLQDAVEKTGVTGIKVLDTNEDGSTPTVAADKNIVLDLNGKTVTLTTATLTNNGTLEIKDTQTGGTITRDGNVVTNKENLTLSSGNIIPVSGYGIANTKTLTVTGGKINGTNGINNSAGTTTISGETTEINGTNKGVRNYGDAEFSISGGKINGDYIGLHNQYYNKTAMISGGEITGGLYNNGGGAAINGGNLNISNNGKIFGKKWGIITSGDITITGGEISANASPIYYGGNGTITIGSLDNTVSKTDPLIKSGVNGTKAISIYNSNNGNPTINFLSGKIVGTQSNFTEDGQLVFGTLNCRVENEGTENEVRYSPVTTKDGIYYETVLEKQVQITADAGVGTIDTAEGWTIAQDNKTATKTGVVNTVYGTLPTVTKPGYTSSGWKVNNAGDIINSGTTITTNESHTINAQWEANKYYVHFDPNDSQEYPATGTMNNQEITYDQSQALTTNVFKRQYYIFNGWNTAADGTGTSYLNGQSVTNLAESGTVTLYAQWKKAVAMFDTGKNVNAAMKKLSGYTSATYGTEDHVINNIVRVNEITDEIINSANTKVVSTSGYGTNTKIYMWFEDQTQEGENKHGIIKWYTEAEKPYMNVNASEMFSRLRELDSILQLNQIDTSKTTNMQNLFLYSNKISSLDVSRFDTSKVTNMERMFLSCSNLSVLDVSGFDTSSATTMYEMFRGCSSLNSITLNRNVTEETAVTATAENMFFNCSGLETLNLSGFKTNKITNMKYMFFGCSNLSVLDVSGFDTSQVTSFKGMFNGCSSLNSITINRNVTEETAVTATAESMFYGCSGLETLNISGFKTNKITNMEMMFRDCSSLVNLDVSGFDTSQVTTFGSMFSGCSNLSVLDVSGFDTSQVTSFNSMFYGCSGLDSITINRNVTEETAVAVTAASMFYGCSGLETLNISGFKTNKITNMENMFRNCSSLVNLDLRLFDTSSVTSMSLMFYGCSKLKTIYATDSFVIKDNNVSTSNMFYNCKVLKGGAGKSYSSSHVNGTYAWIDGKIDPTTSSARTGYFTNHYYLTFNKNGGTGTMTKQSIIIGVETALSTNLFTRQGYIFAGWNTAADGTGTAYADQALVTDIAELGKTLTLYAQWETAPHTITYNFSENGGTASTKTTDSLKEGLPVDLTSTATKEGWNFVGWNTNKDATTGLSSLTMGNTDLTLYAIYSKTLTGTFKYYNDQTYVNTSAQQVVIYNNGTSGSITTPAAQGTPNNCTFNYWSTSTSGNVDPSTPTTVAENTSVTINQDTTFYASYVEQVEITFNYFDANESGTGAASTTVNANRYINYVGTITQTQITNIPVVVTSNKSTTAYILGDVDNNGSIGTNDITQLKRFMNGNATPTYAEYHAADVNEDGVLDDTDEEYFKNYLKHTSPTFISVPVPIKIYTYIGISTDSNADSSVIPAANITTANTTYYVKYSEPVAVTFNYFDPSESGTGAASTTVNTNRYINYAGVIGNVPISNIPAAVTSNKTTPAYKLGDPNNSGSVDTGDRSLVNGYINGTRTLTFAEYHAADVNQDGEVDDTDKTWISDYMKKTAFNFTCVDIPSETYTYLGISTDTNADSTVLSSANVTTANTTYYVKYSRPVAVTYNSNEGEGTIADQTATQYVNASGNTSSNNITLASSGFTKEGYEIDNWNIGGTSGTAYAKGDTYELNPAFGTYGKRLFIAKWGQL